ncbi:MAG TPA: YicC/YloC family endoribonuclease [Bacteroidia bacterium]|nr:YicC/YloC family endoribonuclease [Bacteroidia bacterium]
MLQSMTGYGSASARSGGKKIDIEIRSLNSKQQDINLRMPFFYNKAEPGIRSVLAELLDRGKIDISVSVSTDKGNGVASLNKELARHYYNELKSFAKEINEKNVPFMPMLTRFPDLFKVEETVKEAEVDAVVALVKKAALAVAKFRLAEGKELSKDIISHLSVIEKNIVEIEKLDKARIPKLKEKLKSKITEEISGKIDMNRFEQEIIFYIEKFDINEEKSRLKTHCAYFRENLNEDKGGRKLGFISQEIGREINTIGSKANDSGIQKFVVEMKDELEKVKEQLLNVL